MSKYIRVTHTYLVPMPDDLPDDDPAMESTMIAGVSMMENHMKKLYTDPRRCVDLLSTWELVGEEERKAVEKKVGMGIEKTDITFDQGKVPKRAPTRGPLPRNESEFDRITSLHAIEGDFDRGISFAQDVMGQRDAKVPHPWDQGLYMFPEDHPLRKIEEEYRRRYAISETSARSQQVLESFKNAIRELPTGEVIDE